MNTEAHWAVELYSGSRVLPVHIDTDTTQSDGPDDDYIHYSNSETTMAESAPRPTLHGANITPIVRKVRVARAYKGIVYD